jgi:hypothetical protein
MESISLAMSTTWCESVTPDRYGISLDVHAFEEIYLLIACTPIPDHTKLEL